MDSMTREYNTPILAINDFGRVGQLLFDRRGHGNDLKRRARLEHPSHSPVHSRLGRAFAELIGVERGVAGHGQNLAGVGVLDDDRAVRHAPFCRGFGEGLLGDVLDILVKRQDDVLPRLSLAPG